MAPFRSLTGIAAPLLRASVDTDAIIPSREMSRLAKRGLAAGLFAGWRYREIGTRDPDPAFVLNQPAYRGARILLAGENFGCGSSREHAVWALAEFGIGALIAPSFAPIFRANCVRNGVVPVVLPAATIAALATRVAADPAATPVTVDLAAQRVTAPGGFEAAFEFDALEREMLLSGADVIDLSLREHAAIAAFQARDRQARPWIYAPGAPP